MTENGETLLVLVLAIISHAIVQGLDTTAATAVAAAAVDGDAAAANVI